MVWNYQGTVSREFRRTLSELIKFHNPEIVGLLETKNSREPANNFCMQLGFENWVRVEAVGYSGGIWIFWNGSKCHVEVVKTHSQFILC